MYKPNVTSLRTIQTTVYDNSCISVSVLHSLYRQFISCCGLYDNMFGPFSHRAFINPRGKVRYTGCSFTVIQHQVRVSLDMRGNDNGIFGPTISQLPANLIFM